MRTNCRVLGLEPYKLVSELWFKRKLNSSSNVEHQIAFDHRDLAVYDYSHILNLTPIVITPTFYLVPVLMAMTIRTRWIRRGALIRRLTERRARCAAAVRTVIFGRRRILAHVPLMVVPPAAEDEQELPTQKVILAFPAPNAPSTTREVMRSGLSNSFYRRGRDVFAVRHQPPSCSGRSPVGNLKYTSLVCINVQDEVLWEIVVTYLMSRYTCSGPDPVGK
ncbi:hypothetical protein L1987_22985 [Smallanthus sonchifolius]|uniref:Uncharacterized protein n=1 Tax=Smallanthus sonchifolius TaxID=185202 RepID=A0ACB9IGJ9_9ASTR|nr:hypothetical protein L1987_22985 [Smallanthus sonchifolius]